MPCDLDRRSLLDIPVGAIKSYNSVEFILRIKVQHVLQDFAVNEFYSVLR